ncbi:MAG: hypothetical protein LBG78_07165 [Azoarcus sp.]|jgi:hypothetical protein|nr:hypothetical protein [Azoarcus sp.]
MRKALLITSALILAACESAPPPPTVDGSARQPVNDAATVSLLADGFVVSRAATDKDKGALTGLSKTFRFSFPPAAKWLVIPEKDRKELVHLANKADRIIIRSRTDASQWSQSDQNAAKSRAVSARDFLARNGVKPDKITLDYISAGDYRADNSTADGRALNRRVEIDIFAITQYR